MNHAIFRIISLILAISTGEVVKSQVMVEDLLFDDSSASTTWYLEMDSSSLDFPCGTFTLYKLEKNNLPHNWNRVLEITVIKEGSQISLCNIALNNFEKICLLEDTRIQIKRDCITAKVVVYVPNKSLEELEVELADSKSENGQVDIIILKKNCP